MTEFPCPKITIGGVCMQMQSFAWTLLPGVLPYTMSFKIPKGGDFDAALRAVTNPTTMRMDVYGGTQGTPDPVTLEFQQLYLLEPKEIDPYHVRWTIADTRWNWRGKLMWYCYNKTKRTNVKGITVNASDTTPASLRQPFDTFAQGRYVYWTMYGQERPWNMKEMLEDQLTKLGIPFDPNISGNDGAYIIENVVGDGVPVYTGLANLLSASRLNLGIKPNGDVYVYSLDYYDDTQINLVAQWQASAKTKPGTIYMEEKKRIKPKKVRVRFDRKIEVRVVDATSNELAHSVRSGPNFRLPVSANPPLWEQEDIDNWRVIGCQNMVQCPYPVWSSYANREIQIGEYLPMWEYLSSLSPAITDQTVREYYFSELLERNWASQLDAGVPTENNEVFAQHVISAIKRDYRKLYQIDPYILDRIKSWEPRRVSIINDYDHYSPPSPLFADYCVLPGKRHPSQAKRVALWDTQAYNWYVDQRDPYRQQATAGTITVVDENLGLFRVSYPALVDMTLKAIIESALSPLPSPLVSGNFLEECHLVATHTLETIISVVFANYKNLGYESTENMHTVEFDYSQQGGLGPEIDYHSTLETARIPAKEFDPTSAGVGAAAGFLYDPNTPVNLGVLQGIAQAEAGRLMNQYIDRYVGLVTLAGKVDLQLTGPMKGITYSFSPSSGLETIIDMRDAPPAPTIEQQLNARTLHYLKQQVSRGDEHRIMGRP